GVGTIFFSDGAFFFLSMFLCDGRKFIWHFLRGYGIICYLSLWLAGVLYSVLALV
ncbi:hypothetical protein FN846DRAFT_929995, partial [Sphaerosporella brunnea]